MKINCATASLKKARVYSEAEFLKIHKSLNKVIPNFDRNYILLQDRCLNALNIPRSQMPVIEPVDMAKFHRKIKKGHIDDFSKAGLASIGQRDVFDEVTGCPICEAKAHKEHLTDWVKMKHTCPVCKKALNVSSSGVIFFD